MKRFLNFLPGLQLYVIASLGVALVFDAIRRAVVTGSGCTRCKDLGWYEGP